MLSHKEMTAHIRSRIKAAGIKARVRMTPAAGQYAVQVISPSYGVKFTGDQAREIAFICDCNKLTGVRGDAINVDLYSQLSGKDQFDFYLPMVGA